MYDAMKRQSNYFYVPLGVQLLYKRERMLVQSQLEFDYLLYGIQKTDYSSRVKPDPTSDVKQEQHNWDNK